MALNFALPTYSLMLGVNDLSDNLLSWHLSSPHCELSTPQSRTGDFAIKVLPFQNPDLYSDFEHPETWAKGQLVMTMTVAGYLIFTGYILEYFFDPDTGIGQGTFGDQIALQKSLQVTQAISINVGGGTPTQNVVAALVLQSGYRKGVQVFSDYVISSLTGLQTVPISTRDPLGDAQSFLKADKKWLYCNQAGQIRDVNYPDSGRPLFVRSRNQFKAERDRVVAAYPVQRLIVTGARDYAKPNDQIQPEQNHVVRETIGEYASAIPDWSDLSGAGSGSASDFLNYVTGVTQRITEDTLAGGVTRTKTEELAGAIFGDNLSPTTPLNVLTLLVTAEIVTNDPVAGTKTTQTARGLKTPSLCYTDNYISSGQSIGISSNDDSETSTRYFDFAKAIQLATEVEAIVEGNDYQPPIDNASQQAPFQPDKLPVRGECLLNPAGYLVYLQAEDVREVGYLYDNAQATLLAKHLADLEIQKSKALLIEMPVPTEWLANPTPFAICHLHNVAAIIDAPELYIDGNDGTCRLVFTANVMGRIATVPERPDPPLYLPSALFRVIPVQAQLYSKDIAIAALQFAAENGTAPYTWGATGLPTGLSLSSSGLLTGTPTVVQAATNATITATDATAATANLTVSFTVEAIAVPDPGYGGVFESDAITYAKAVSTNILIPQFGYNAITYAKAVTAVSSSFPTPGVAYTVTENEAYTYSAEQGGQGLDKLNDGTLTAGALRLGATGTDDVFEFYISFSSSTIGIVAFWLRQFNGNFNKPNQIEIYDGTSSAGTLLTTIASTTYGLNYYDLGGVTTTDLCFRCTLFDSAFDECAIAELQIYT
jgi:hypothetical protein